MAIIRWKLSSFSPANAEKRKVFWENLDFSKVFPIVCIFNNFKAYPFERSQTAWLRLLVIYCPDPKTDAQTFGWGPSTQKSCPHYCNSDTPWISSFTTIMTKNSHIALFKLAARMFNPTGHKTLGCCSTWVTWALFPSPLGAQVKQVPL